MLQEAKSREADSEGEEGEIEQQPLLKAEAEEEEGGEAGKNAGELGREGHRLKGGRARARFYRLARPSRLARR